MNRRASLQHLMKTGLITAGAGSFLAADPAAANDESAEPPNPPLIDCHLHINHFDRSVEDTIRHMDATGTRQAFVLPLETGEGGVLLKSETVLHAWHAYPDRVIPFCQTDLRRNDFEDRLRAYKLLGCRGVGEQKNISH